MCYTNGILCPNCGLILAPRIILTYGGFHIDYKCEYCGYSSMQGGTTYSDRTEYTNNTTTGDKTYEVH